MAGKKGRVIHDRLRRLLFLDCAYRLQTEEVKFENVFISVLHGSNIPHPWNINKQKFNIMFMDTEQTTGGSLSTEQHTASLVSFLDVAKIVVLQL